MKSTARVASRALVGMAGAALVSGCISCPPVVNDGVVQLPCCTSGTANIVRVDTGSAPWKVRIPSLTYSQPVLSPAPNIAWATVDSSAWVRPPGGANPDSHAGGVYSYTIPFRVQACGVGRTLTISGRFAADNTASAFLDTPGGPGSSPFATQTTQTHGFQTANITSFSTTVTSAAAGIYTLRFEVTNEQNGFNSDSGLAVSAVIATNCSSAPS
ncbi:MAG TPA: hypothetical protein VF577_08125 [Allosphingosinicella sp.]|jgi:hypothetical protein